MGVTVYVVLEHKDGHRFFLNAFVTMEDALKTATAMLQCGVVVEIWKRGFNKEAV